MPYPERSASRNSINICRGVASMLMLSLSGCAFTNTQVAPPAVAVSISPTSASMLTGGTQQFAATVSGTTNTAVTWSATGGSISSAGLYTASSTAGTYAVKATSVADTTKSATAAVTVTTPSVTVSISPTSSSLQAGQSQQFTATVTGTTNTAVNWSVNGIVGGSSTTGVVSSTGLYTAPPTVTSNQTVTVTVSSIADPNQSASATVTIMPISSQVSVSISPTSVSVQTGQSIQFTASVMGTTNTSVTWLVNGVSGGSAAVGTISSTGFYLAPASVPSADPVTVTAQSVFDPTKSANATVTIAAVTACVGTCYYVSPAGLDSNPGTSAAPFQTIQHAADIVNPGDTVIVEDGTYNGGCGAGTNTVNVSRSGTSGNVITFKSQNKYGAVLNGGNVCQDGFNLDGASYITVQDFDITGYAAGATSGYAVGIEIDCTSCSTGIDIVGNKIHDIGKVCTDTANGQNGIYIAASHITVERNTIYNIGRFAPGENGCNPGTAYYQNHDHGIYDHNSDHVTIQNNIFYNNARGWSIQLYPGASTNVLVVNNTFSDPNPYRQGQIICWGTGTMSGFISNNIFYQPNTAAIWDQYCAGITVNYNLSTNSDQYNQCGSSCASYANDLLNQNPATIMVSPDTDFHLILGSPAIGAGTTTNAPATDFNGNPRNNPPSIGAYEWGSTP